MARSSSRPGAPRPTAGEQGSILIWAMLFAIITSAMIVSHSTYMAANRREMNVRFEHATLSETFAKGGLTDSLTWFQRQPTQPVTSFAPKLEPNGDPPLLDTLDPTIGLVREFEVRGNIWARYEVRTEEVFDISTQRSLTTPGMVWDIGSRSFLFYRHDPTKPFDEGPNRVMATTYLRTELQGLPIVPPASAAIGVDDPMLVELGPNVDVLGEGGPAIAYPDGETAPTEFGPGTLDGPVVAQIGYDAGVEEVFSMHSEQLRSLSDYVVEEGEAAAGTPPAGNGGDGGTSGPQSGSSGSGSSGSDSDSSGSGCRALVPLTASAAEQLLAQTLAQGGTTAANGELRAWWWLEWLGLWRSKWQANKESMAGTSTVTSATQLGWRQRSFAVGRGQVGAMERPRELTNRAIYIDHSVVLGPDDSMSGRVLLVVNGDLTFADGNTSSLQGIVYVTGDCEIRGNVRIDGMLIVRGRLKAGLGTEPVVIRRDPIQVDTLKRALERYRLSRSIRPG